eukprot:NODE_4754_length_1851_cov_9.882251.p1 GENE.NODE_4754_length_1851_cov_9.882251~~NODE_4754_length_1851_cov_9.882251.p1  ORF type:complete len:393 (+),score=42.77 NODE_4754_length_1851_cov_9.882251:148-1326(+)
MTFGDFPPSANTTGRFLHHTALTEHLLAYAQHHHLEDYVEFGSEVESVSQVMAGRDEGWVVRVNNRNRRFGKVCLCTGAARKPHIPEVPVGAGTHAFHSSAFGACSLGDFDGKHVVVAGFGPSAADICEAVAERAASVTVVMRASVRVLPKAVMLMRDYQLSFVLSSTALWRVIDGHATVVPLGAPKDEENKTLVTTNNLIDLLTAGRVTARLGALVECRGGRALLQDGTDIPADIVAWCSGYCNTGFNAVEPGLRAQLLSAPLYLHVWHPDLLDLAIVGNGGHGWIVIEAQARLAAMVWSGRLQRPDAEAMRSWCADLKEAKKSHARWTHDGLGGLLVFIETTKLMGCAFTPFEAMVGALSPFRPDAFFASERLSRSNWRSTSCCASVQGS